MGGTDGNEVEVMPSQRAKRHWSSFSWKSHIFRSSVMTDVLLYASCWPDIWETEFCCRIKGESFTFLKEQTNWLKCLFVFSNVKQEGWYHFLFFFNQVKYLHLHLHRQHMLNLLKSLFCGDYMLSVFHSLC